MRVLVGTLPVYTGPFGPDEAERLLWRAGFGPRSGESQHLASLGLQRAVDSLVHPPAQDRLVGKPPIVDGHPIAPKDAFGHDHLWWLDKMVRTSRPLVERMTLIWHDWFATSNATVGSQKLMLQQNELFRQIGLGSFKGLAMRVTINPAMLLYLNGLNSIKGSPNENYAREMMELFTLGHGSGYTERDVREQARALTGWTADYRNGIGWTRFHFKRENHDDAMKVIFGKPGPFNWKSAVKLCLEHPAHAGYFVNKLWSYFIPEPPDKGTASVLEQLYVHSGYEIRPVVTAILKHPLLYTGPRMTKSPVVYTAGLLRTRGDRIETEDWIWLDAMAGQQLFYPPNVSGWNDDRWLDTSTFRARWLIARRALQKHAFSPDHIAHADRPPADPQKLVDRALGWWGSLRVSPQTRGSLLDYAEKNMNAAVADDYRQKAFPVMTYNGLRHLAAISPEMQTA
jgi:uncharacterized protein (DUF1800 family)